MLWSLGVGRGEKGGGRRGAAGEKGRKGGKSGHFDSNKAIRISHAREEEGSPEFF